MKGRAMVKHSDDDVANLLDWCAANGVDGSIASNRGWNHIGAVVADAVLQRRQNYERVVRPRVKHLMAEWPDAATTSGLVKRLESDDLATTLQWTGEQRLSEFREIVKVLQLFKIETVSDFAHALSEPVSCGELRSALDNVKYVGQKTLDYLDILVGLQNTAVDYRIHKVFAAAGLDNMSNKAIKQVIILAADLKHWKLTDLDAALWKAGERQ